MTKFKSIAFKLSVLILSSCILIFAVIFGYNYLFSRRIISEDIHQNAENLTLAVVNKIEIVLRSVENVPRTLAYFLEHSSYDKEDLIELLRSVVDGNPEIYGSTIAFEPNSFEKESYYFAPYLYKKIIDGRPQPAQLSYLGSDNYKYFSLDWYSIPKKKVAPVWSEPYYDEGGGNILMSTYSAPFYRVEGGNRIFAGVVTADVSLEWLEKIVSSIKIGRSGYGFLVSGSGKIVTHPNNEFIMKKNILDFGASRGDPNLQNIAREMIGRKSGYAPVDNLIPDKKCWLIYMPLATSGWSLGVVFAQDELFAGITRLNRMVLALGVIGLFFLLTVIILIARTITRPLRNLARLTQDIGRGNFDFELSPVKSRDEVGALIDSFNYMKGALKEYVKDLTETTKAKESMESELRIAHDIQMSILPKGIPVFEGGNTIDIYADLEPAKEVGGDFYDFFLIGPNKLCFTVADVSDKGVPAALFMSMTKALIRMAAKTSNSPAEILDKVNKGVCQENEALMFVTIFLGILEMQTGEVNFSNAGHNPPLVIRSTGKADYLTGAKSTAVGLNADTLFKQDKINLGAGDLIFVYTDGVTEAFSAGCQQFGDERLAQELSLKFALPMKELTRGLISSVKNFCKGAVQSDDITTLALRYRPQYDTGIPAKLDVILNNELPEIEKLNAALENFARDHRLPQALSYDLRLILEELVSNIISYAWPDKLRHRLEIRLIIKDKKILAQISDDGRPFNPLEHPQIDKSQPVAERDYRGAGIFLARNLADKLEYRRENAKNILSFSCSIKEKKMLDF